MGSDKLGSGAESGMDLSKIKLFEHYPDSEMIRSDVADYYWEVQRFDRELGEFLGQLKELGVLDNTLVVVTGDQTVAPPNKNTHPGGVDDSKDQGYATLPGWVGTRPATDSSFSGHDACRARDGRDVFRVSFCGRFCSGARPR